MPEMCKGQFVILKDGVLEYYSDFGSIPDSFENLVRCEFEFPEGPHTDEEHEMMESYSDLLKELLKRETK